MAILATLFLLAPSASLQEPEKLATRIEEVTVFSGTALVRRRAELPAGGRYVIEGLPWSADPDSVRVKLSGGDVLGVETRERHLPAMPNARVEELRVKLRALERDRKVLADELEVIAQTEAHLLRLMKLEEAQHGEDVEKGRGGAASWRDNLVFLTTELTRNKTAARETAWKAQELDRQLEDLRREIGRGETGAGVDLREAVIDVQATGAIVLDLEYRVANAGWAPKYDLRAASDGRSVDLAYRAQVWQQSGEDWNEAEIALSTAHPQVGAQGPDPQPIWLRLFDPKDKLTASERRSAKDLKSVGYAEVADRESAPLEAAPPRPFASVESQGLSVRFRLARRETIQSREAPTDVLVGQAKLDATPEYFATPALSNSVWLRGKTKNTSAWTLLPGPASVYFGADYIGRAQLAAVQPGEEFTLHLGPDPALAIERKKIEDLTKGPGVFGSKTTQVDGWRIHLKNNGAAAAGPDGRATVFVRESLPRAADDRIKVELSDAKPQPSGDARWKQDRDEQGILTWVVSIPRNGETDIVWQQKISFPEGTQVLR
jgi:uncharacterized protein (TIGR02231 family)